MSIEKLVIIGSGPAGLTAALYAARAFLKPVLIEGSSPGGQLMGTTYVENWPGTTSVLGPQLIISMQDQVRNFETTIISEHVTSVDFSQRPFTIVTNKDRTIQALSVIIATGASPNKLHCPGESTYWGKGVTVCAVCDGAFYPNKKVLIVGGGDTAMEDATFMTNYTKDITIVHILDAFTASPIMQKKLANKSHIKTYFNHTVTEIRGNGNHVTHALIKNTHTGMQELIETDVIFLAIGQKPNTAIFATQLECLKGGYIKVFDETRTSVEGVFVAGDVADYRYKQAITSAASGCKAALDAQRYLEGLNI